jgi:hypothetical protein
MTWEMARVATANDRQEQIRLPGAPMGLVLANITLPNAAGDFERHIAWLEKFVPEYMDEEFD